MRHQFAWHDGPLEIEIRSAKVSFLGAFICDNCGFRMPCGDEAMKSYMASEIRVWDEDEMEDDCSLILLEKVLLS